MIKYIENREKQPNLACPQSTIFYPFRLVKESQLELPQGTRVKILDLPVWPMWAIEVTQM